MRVGRFNGLSVLKSVQNLKYVLYKEHTIVLLVTNSLTVFFPKKKTSHHLCLPELLQCQPI